VENNRKRVLFICIHNSARSQMAEAFLNSMAPDRFFAESAGLEKGSLNPFAVKAMLEDGIDISGNSTKSVMDFVNNGVTYDYVVAVCDKEAAERCPIFPGSGEKLHWGFADPSSASGSDADKLDAARKVRDEIKEKIIEWIKS
jgi:arsenate reductase